MLQPGIASSYPTLCLNNTESIGKMFTLDVSDNRGNLISTSEVTVSP
jgi:hypothetical protein